VYDTHPSERVERPVGAAVLLFAALRLAERGRPVFPCRVANKRPLVPRGFHEASTDPEAIRRWWTRWPTALIGMPTGASSGMVVVDLDVKNGHDGIAAFEALRAGRELPPHPLVQTRSGGRHLYFATVPGRTIRCSASRLAPGVDVRGDGGYVITPPSPGYEPLHRAPLAPPPWLLDLLDPPPAPRPQHQPRATTNDADEDAERLMRLVGFVAAASEGERNSVLFWAVCCAAENGLPERSTAIALEEAATTAGLSKKEAERTIASARRHMA
jgi:hypothetical protein